MANADIDDVLDLLRGIKSKAVRTRRVAVVGSLVIKRRIKNKGDLNVVKKLEIELRFFRTFIKYPHVLLPEDSSGKVRKKAKLIVEMLHSVFGGIPYERETNPAVERLVSQLLEFHEGDTSLGYTYELNDSYMSEYVDCLGKNLNDVAMCRDRSDPSLKNESQILRFLKQVKIIQKKMMFLRNLYATKINGYVDHEKLEGLKTRIQFTADNVGQFCLALWLHEDQDDVDSDEITDDSNSDEVYDDADFELVSDYSDFDEVSDDTESNEGEDDTHDDILNKPPYLLALIVLVQLEMQRIFLIELKASKFSRSRTFKNQELPKDLSHHLHNLLVYLTNKMLETFPDDVSAQNIDVAIEFLLIFLADVQNSVIKGKKSNEVLEKVGAFVGDVLPVIHKFLPSSNVNDDTSKIKRCLIQILEKLENLNAQVEGYYKSIKFIPSQFPTIGGLGFLDTLLRKLNEMLKSESGLYFMMNPQVSILEKELSSLTLIFREVAKVQYEHESVEDLKKRAVNLAYAAEVAIDSILVQPNSLWRVFCSLPTIIKEIKDISAEVAKMDLKPCSMVKPSNHLPTQDNNHVNDEDMVGFENEAETITQYLLRGTNELDVIPIVGMGGQGKTTIARKVYNGERVVSCFDDLAWCCISQTYDRIELLREIYDQVSKSKEKVEADEVADKLRKCLMRRRYLIVLDDMWDVKAWEDLGLSLPHGKEGSRIIVTTRLVGVGMQIKHHTDPYHLPFLTLDESCKLLQKKVFQQESCPPEIQDVSLSVAKRCKGLPLVVVLVAGIIKKKKTEESWWRKVGNSLYSYLGESEEYSVSTMRLSYDNLADHLRPCLLYMGMFPEDARIPVSKLISLWIAEGFVENIESGRLEEAAEAYLTDLISSNVVMISRKGYNGKVKYCRLHDVVLDFCLKTSIEENFMLVAKGHHSHFRTSGSYRLSFNFTDRNFTVALSGSKTRKPSNLPLRSLITTNRRCLGRLVSKLVLLKVLDLSSHYVIEFSSDILVQLIHLKYLAVRAERRFIFHPEPHLPHLETIIVFCQYPVLLPENFWKMEKLRHAEIYNANPDLKNYKQYVFGESFKLENLRMLKYVFFCICDADRMDVLLRRCPNLQELKIYIFGDKEDDTEIGTSILKLESFTQLQSLDILFFDGNNMVSEMHMPSNLKKLKLDGKNAINMASLIGGLPSLEYLKLHSWNDPEFGNWCLNDITFDKLKLLKLVHLRIKRWYVSEESFPMLETLVIKNCHRLKKIPRSFADIQTLKQIKLRGNIRESLKDSAVKIKEEVKEIEGCDRVELIM